MTEQGNPLQQPVTFGVLGGVHRMNPELVAYITSWDNGSTILTTRAEYDPVTGLVFNIEQKDGAEVCTLDDEQIKLPDGSVRPVVGFNSAYVNAESAIVRFHDEKDAADVAELKVGHYYFAQGIDEQFTDILKLSGEWVGRYCVERFEAVFTADLLRNYPEIVEEHPHLVAGYYEPAPAGFNRDFFNEQLQEIINEVQGIQQTLEQALEAGHFSTEVDHTSRFREHTSRAIQILNGLLTGDVKIMKAVKSGL